MLNRRLRCLSVVVLIIAAIAAMELNGCHKLPVDDYATIMSCCRNSPIVYNEEIMSRCRFFNSSTENFHKDLILMNVCEKYCYLNHYDVIDENGTIENEKLVTFLKMHTSEEFHEPLVGFVAKCLPEVEFLKDFQVHPPNCHWYYTAVIDCIQGELYVNCPNSVKDSSEVCEHSRAFVRYCSLTALREAFNHKGERLNQTYTGEEPSSYYDSDESLDSNSQSSEYESQERGSLYE